MFGLAKKKTDVLSHWYTLLDGFQYSTADFYAEIEKELAARQVPRLNISRVEYHEGSVLSEKRVYLRLARERFAFDVCAAPFGRGYFFSLRLVEIPRSRIGSVIAALIVFGGIAVLVKGCLVNESQGYGSYQSRQSALQFFMWIAIIGLSIYLYIRLTRKTTVSTDGVKVDPGIVPQAPEDSGETIEPVEVAFARHGIEMEATESESIEPEKEVSVPIRATPVGPPDLGSLMLNLPIVGDLYEAFRKDTYYRHDTRLMYLTLVSEIVKKKVEEVSAAKGIKLLETHEHSPILADLYKPTTVALGK